MSNISFRPRGGQEGIAFTDEEQRELARKKNMKVTDLYVPLPQGNPDKCSLGDKCGDTAMQYFENENGRHGWCCSVCGKVYQWG